MELFNPKNGQIYKEIITSGRESMLPAWRQHTTGRRVDPHTYKNVAQGAARLQEMAMRACCWHIDQFVPEYLQQEREYFFKIYQHLVRSDTLSFATWTLFHKVFPSEPRLSHRFRVGPRGVDTSWTSIVASLSVLNTGVLTHFCADGIDLHLSHFMSLLDIPTLAALVHVNVPQYGGKSENWNARSIRIWSRAVREKGALRKLKLLFLSLMAEDESTNANILNDLHQLPALSIIGILHALRADHKTSIPDVPVDPWRKPDPQSEAEYSKLLRDPSLSIASKADRLYQSAKHLVSTQEEGENPITVSMTCTWRATSVRDRNAAWYVRSPRATEALSKRPQGNPTPGDSSRAAKKPKVKQVKQQDIGSMLGMFG